MTAKNIFINNLKIDIPTSNKQNVKFNFQINGKQYDSKGFNIYIKKNNKYNIYDGAFWDYLPIIGASKINVDQYQINNKIKDLSTKMTYFRWKGKKYYIEIKNQYITIKCFHRKYINSICQIK